MTRVYTYDELLEMCTHNPDHVVRRIAGEMLYTLGQRDQLAEQLKTEEAKLESLHGERVVV